MAESLPLKTSASLALKYADKEEVTREEEIKLLEEMITDDSPIVNLEARKKTTKRHAPPIPSHFHSLPNPNPPPPKRTSSNRLTPPPCNKQCPNALAV